MPLCTSPTDARQSQPVAVVTPALAAHPSIPHSPFAAGPRRDSLGSLRRSAHLRGRSRVDVLRARLGADAESRRPAAAPVWRIAREGGGVLGRRCQPRARSMGAAQRRARSRASSWYDAQDPQFRKYLDEFARGINEFAAKNPGAIGAESRVVLPVSGVDVVGHPLRAVHYGYMGSRARMNTEVTALLKNQRADGAGRGAQRLIMLELAAGSNTWAIGPARVGERERDAPHQPASVLGQHVLPLHAGAPGRP